MTNAKITPVILCGGSGTRLWPLSRKSFPKQFVPLVDNKSLLQLTLERVAL
jgi:mannose-1-phosphate guanylyltransferase/mannose-6-phosphate isomerase